jgi:hypothetical protein
MKSENENIQCRGPNPIPEAIQSIIASIKSFHEVEIKQLHRLTKRKSQILRILSQE